MEERTGWTARVEAGSVVAEFPGGTRLTPSEADDAIAALASLIREHDVGAGVLVVRTTRPCSDAGRRMLREVAQVGVANDVTRWAIVAQRSKREFLRRTVEVAGLTVEGFNDPEPAVDWATAHADAVRTGSTDSSPANADSKP
ncbi:hypothetical protein JCM17823_23310 [Halorubrum gandharaense]